MRRSDWISMTALAAMLAVAVDLSVGVLADPPQPEAPARAEGIERQEIEDLVDAALATSLRGAPRRPGESAGTATLRSPHHDDAQQGG